MQNLEGCIKQVVVQISHFYAPQKFVLPTNYLVVRHNQENRFDNDSPPDLNVLWNISISISIHIYYVCAVECIFSTAKSEKEFYILCYDDKQSRPGAHFVRSSCYQLLATPTAFLYGGDIYYTLPCVYTLHQPISLPTAKEQNTHKLDKSICLQLYFSVCEQILHIVFFVIQSFS